ncbi:MAG: DNA polymerase III subunit beta [Bacteroides sp.]|nr:DNA polymerase III subunit beta [Bacteroides sp.]MCM1378725.1 DNA polymerase III subunit beta [Bacteroides sp.]MCM1444998.1 DNA polymerase III subunit beta [Prevotella sp.]
MKFNVESKVLYGSASAVSKVINSKNPMPILNNFLLELKDSVLTITASDIENTLSARIPVMEAEGEGKFCVDARRLTDLLKSMPDIGITFEIDDESLAIQVTYNGGAGKFDFIGLVGDEYPTPQVATDADAVNFTVSSAQIVQGIDNTIFAVGNDTLRPQMMGIYWDVMEDGITFVATDTRKLVRYRNTLSAPGVTTSCIMPTKPAQVLKNVLPKDADVKVSIDGKRALIETDEITFSCQLLKGVYPNYNRVVPENNSYTMTVDRESFLSALRRVSVFGDQGQNQVKLRITPTQVTVKAVDNAYCTRAVENVACDFDKDEMVIGFSAPYVMEIFSTITTTEVVVSLSDPSRPGVFRPSEQGEHSDVLMILMPMNVTEF